MVKATRWTVVGGATAAALLYAGMHAQAGAPPQSFVNELRDNPAVSVSTVPLNTPEAGDQNPYGVAVVPISSGKLKSGHILVSNFNNGNNNQGTGSTIVDINPRDPDDGPRVFFDSAGAANQIGLTTALAVLRAGFVVVGAAPLDSTVTPNSVTDGALLFLDHNGAVVLALTDSALIKGAWDMTVDDNDPDHPRLFVSSVLSGTVLRINVHAKNHSISIESITKIGSGFKFRTDPAALVVGPTGLAWDSERDELFVADTGANRIAEIDHASTVDHDRGAGGTVFCGAPLQGPLGLALSPERTLVMVNGDAVPSNTPNNLVVEISRSGVLLATKQLDPGAPGALFGIAITVFEREPSLVFVDDNDATVKVLKTR